jgi:osmotically-inducible protein OsmY
MAEGAGLGRTDHGHDRLQGQRPRTAQRHVGASPSCAARDSQATHVGSVRIIPKRERHWERPLLASARWRSAVLASAGAERHVRGVTGLTNVVNFTPSVTPERVAEQIEEAFKREAEVDARHIRVEVADHTARLFGHVHSLTEASMASAAAAAAPGVAKVENHLVVSP